MHSVYPPMVPFQLISSNISNLFHTVTGKQMDDITPIQFNCSLYESHNISINKDYYILKNTRISLVQPKRVQERVQERRLCRCKMNVLMLARYFTPQHGLKEWSEGGGTIY